MIRVTRMALVRIAAWVAVSFLICAAFPGVASAQVDTGNITGTVTDSTGGALPGVTITVMGLSTGVARTTVTSEAGHFQVSALQPASYSVKADLQGFATIVRSQVTVSVGGTIDVNITMHVANVEETVNVTSEAPLVESTKTAVSEVIGQEQLQSLPSLNRQYLDFVLLLPATIDSTSITQQGAGFSLGGARSSEATLLVDGFYNMDEGFALPKQRYSQDSVQEFQVTSFGGEAQYGRAIGGVLNGITKSGGNTPHGTAYDFYQSEELNSNDVASINRGIAKPPYGRQQWGGTLGGPIKHDRTFVFGAYERVKQDQTFDNRITAADGAALGLPPQDIGNIPSFYRLNFALAKVDHNLSASDRIQGSLALSRWTEYNLNTPAAFNTRSRQGNLEATDLSYLFKWTKVQGDGHFVHEGKVAYSPRFYGLTGVNQGGPPLVAEGQVNPPGVFQSNASIPGVAITSVATFGSIGLNNHVDTNPVQAIYSSSLFTGRHNIKFGADYMNAFYDYSSYASLKGSYTFSSLANYRAGVYAQYSQSFGDPHNPRRHEYVSGFLQDSWRAGDRLTLNYGVRYDLEVHPTSPTGDRLGWDRNNVGPRFALSYDLTGQGDTFLKFASGVYYDRIFQNISGFYTNIVGFEQLTSATWTPTTPGAPVFPNVFATPPASLPAGITNSNILPSDFRTPASSQATATFERALSQTVKFSATATYTHGWDIDYGWDTNILWNGTALVRPNAKYRVISQYQFDGWRNYVGGIFELRRRGQRAGFSTSVTVQRARDIGNNYGSTPSDQRQGIASEYGAQADTPNVRGVVSGWFNATSAIQVSANTVMRSGRPVDPQAPGFDVYGTGVLGGRTPTFGRNSFRGPDYSQTDARFTWKLPLRPSISVYLESFNLFDQVNPKSTSNDYGPTPGQPKAIFLTPLSWYPKRQIQLGAHWKF